MKIFAISISALLFLQLQVSAQQDIDSVISGVARNNQSLQAQEKLTRAREAQYQTGLTLYDPFVEYDYMFGSPAGAGNQRDFAVTQRLDFPTVYGRRKQLAASQGGQARLQQAAFRQELLLEAKLLALEVVYLNRKRAELQRRQAATEKLVADTRKKLDQGEVIVLDMNKAKLQLLSIRNDRELAENQRTVLLTRISSLNGGQEVNIQDTLYPAVPDLPNFEILDSVIEANDPLIKVYEQEKITKGQQVQLQKALNLPKLETGYHSQGILGQSYRGFHVGMAIPLWENRNRLKAAKAELDYATEAALAMRLEHRMENRQYYEQLEVRRQQLQEYRDLLQSLNNAYLLEKALKLGQITVVQYFNEESFYYSNYDKYLQVEMEYHKALAQLYKYLL